MTQPNPPLAPYPMSKTALAQAYFPHVKPHTACEKMHQLILHTPGLLTALRRAGYNPHGSTRIYSARQVALIVRKIHPP